MRPLKTPTLRLLRFAKLLALMLALAACGGPRPGSGVPTAPANIAAQPGDGRVTLTWEDRSDNEESFVIFREVVGENLVAENLRAQALEPYATVPANTTTYSDTSVNPTTEYAYGVAARNAAGTSPVVEIAEPVQPNPAAGRARLSVTRLGTGQGVVTSEPPGIECVQRPTERGDCAEDYSQGTQVTLTARPDAGNLFGGWGGACSGTGPCTVTMSESRTVSATFVKERSTLTVAKSGSGAGTVLDVNSSGGLINCGADCTESLRTNEDVIVLEARPAEGSLFAGWQDCPDERGSGRCWVVLPDDLTVTARFSLPSLSVQSFTASDENVEAGTEVTLSWNVSGDDPYTLTLTNSRTGETRDVTGQTSATVTVTGSVTYTLTAKSYAEEVRANRTITVGNAPEITLFEANRTNVTSGQAVRLEWEVAGAGDIVVTISGVSGTFGPEGQTTIRPDATTTYVLTATSAFGQDTAQVTVTVGTAPVITAFTASPSTILRGSETTLAWTVTGSGPITVAIEGISGTFEASGSTVVNPNATTVYELRATNAFGTTTQLRQVTVVTTPNITSFTATPPAIPSGSSSTLAWAATGTGPITYSINQGVGTVSGTSTTVSPTTTTTYTLTSANDYGQDTETVTVTVGAAPVITVFAASPENITTGQSSTLTWAATGAGPISYSIDQQVGSVNDTSTTVSPTATTTYTLTATNTFGTDTETVTVNVGSAPAITNFSASPPAMAVGASSTLSWTATGTTPITYSIDQGIGTINGTSTNVSPTETTTYTLTATNAFGEDTESVTVTVGSPPNITSFSATPETITVGEESVLSWTVTGTAPITYSINQGVGTVSGTSTTVSPTTTTTYTLTSANDYGQDTETVTVTVNPQQFTVAVTTGGDGSGAVNFSPGGSGLGNVRTYDSGQEVTLTAAPEEPGSEFGGWGDDCAGASDTTCTLVVDSNKNATATFNAVNSDVLTTFAGDGSGRVSFSPSGADCTGTCTRSYRRGTALTLSATPNTGSTFGGWSGDCSGGTCQLTVTSDRSVTASFALQTFSLSVARTGDGGGVVRSADGGIECGLDCTETYAYGTSVSLTALEDEGSSFAGWGGACSGETCQVEMTGDQAVSAAFSLDEGGDDEGDDG